MVNRGILPTDEQTGKIPESDSNGKKKN